MPTLRPKIQLVFLTLALLLSACQPSKHRGLIFASMRSGNWELYRLDPGSQKPVNLSRYPAAERFPDWAPDGQKLVFASDREGSFNLYQMDWQGNNLLQLAASPFPDTHPRWSPNGQKIIFVSERFERNENLYLLDLQHRDQAPLRLSSDPHPDYDPAWFPNSQKLVFVSQRTGQSELFQRDLNAAEKPEQLTHDQREKREPAVSPNGHEIIYAARHEKAWQLELLNLDSGEQTPLGSSETWLGFPRWVNQDEWIFTFYKAHTFHLARLKRNGERSLVAVGNGDAREMAWK